MEQVINTRIIRRPMRTALSLPEELTSKADTPLFKLTVGELWEILRLGRMSTLELRQVEEEERRANEVVYTRMTSKQIGAALGLHANTVNTYIDRGVFSRGVVRIGERTTQANIDIARKELMEYHGQYKKYSRK